MMLSCAKVGHDIGSWTAEQFSLVQKFAPANHPLMFPVDERPIYLTLNKCVDQLGDIHIRIIRDFEHRDQLSEKVQLHQAGLLVMILIDALTRSGISGTEVLEWEQGDA
jgi:hypothetical protein